MAQLRVAPWLTESVIPGLADGRYRYFVIYGGRGSGKSDGIAQLMLRLAVTESNINILCARHIQHTIAQSSKSRLEQWIRVAGLQRHFRVTQTQIICKKTNSRFYFRGLSDVTKDNITSINNIKYLWIDEAHSITEEVWQRTYPSIRAPGSRIFITFNPHYETDVLYSLFVSKPHPQALALKINYTENPWFGSTPLQDMRVVDRQTLPFPLYQHIWEGGLRQFNDMPVIYTDRFLSYDESVTNGYDALVISADTAYTVKESSDFTALGCFGKKGNAYYILDLCRGKFEFDALYSTLLAFHERCTRRFGTVRQVIIENKASGISLVQRLRADTRLPIYDYNPGSKDKFSRVCEVLDILHTQFHVPSPRVPWVADYLFELQMFTADGSHSHDDQVDCTSQALRYLRNSTASTLDFNTALLSHLHAGVESVYQT